MKNYRNSHLHNVFLFSLCLILVACQGTTASGHLARAKVQHKAKVEASDLSKIYLPLIFSYREVCPSDTCYYIDSNSGSDSNSGTLPDKPWKTLTNINSAHFQPGTTVLFKRGSAWTGTITVGSSGTADKPIKFTAYGTGAAPLLTNPGDTDNNESIIKARGDYLIIENLQLRDSGVGIYLWSDHNIVQNCEISNTGLGIVARGQYNLITYNYVHDTRMIVNTPGTFGDDWGGDGINIENAHNEVSFNRLVNCEAFSYDYGLGGGAIEIWQNGDYASIHHNWSYNSAGFIEVASDGTGSAINVSMFYNVIINATRFTVIHVTPDHGATVVRNFRVENNTLLDLRSHDPLIGEYIAFSGNPTSGTYYLRNNIIYLSDYYTVTKDPIEHQNNLFYFRNSRTTLGFTAGPGELVRVDPQFVDLANQDFHLKATSPARNAGINLGYTVDFDLNPVPSGNLPDLGAFEFQSH